MIHAISRFFVITMLIMISIAIVAGQGLYWESTTKMPSAKGEEVRSTSCYKPHMFKQSSKENTTIFRLDKEKMYLLDNEKKEYSEMTFEELEALTKQVSGAMEGKMAEMEKYLKDMPPEQRKAMEERMGGANMLGKSKTKIDVAKTTENKNISGYSCMKYILKEEGKEIGSVWTTTGVPDFTSMQKDMKEFSQRVASQMSIKGGQLAAAMGKIEGFPIQTTIAGITTTVLKVEKKNVSASEFEVPSGYKKVTPKQLTDD